MSIFLENVKKFLWCLVYAPEVAFDRYEEIYEEIYKNSEVKETDIDKIQNHIWAQYPDFDFGRVEPYLDTKGVDMGTKNHIIRDTLIERCYAAVFEEEHCIEKAIKLLKTPDDGFEDSTRRLVGGLREIGFSYDEGNYLRATCNLRPVALLLERLWAEFEAHKQDEIDDEATPEAISQEEAKVEPIIAAIPKAKVITVPTLLENIEPMRFIFSNGNFSRFEKLGNVDNEILALQNEISKLRKIQEVGAKLNDSGITSEYVIQNQESLRKLVEATDSLTAIS